MKRLHARLAARGWHLRRLSRIGWMHTLLASLRHRQGLRVFLARKTRVTWKGRLAVEPGSLLGFNEPWPFAASEPGSLILAPGSELMVTGGCFSFKAGAYVHLWDGARLSLGGGDGYASRGLALECRRSIRIGAGVFIGNDVIIRDTDSHELGEAPKSMTQEVVIGDHVWIGARACILKGVTIGSGSVIGAGSVVTRDVPPGSLAVGVPARVTRRGITWR